MENIVKVSIENHKEALRFVESNSKKIEEVAALFIAALKNNGKIIFMGNGGSATDAQHLAAELVGRFKKDRPSLAALALSANPAVLTAIGNDFGFENIFSRQIESLATPCDLVVGLSTSGDSENIIKAVRQAKDQGVMTLGFLGKDGGKLKDQVDVSLIIPTFDTPRIQEMHIFIGHIICEIVEAIIFTN